MRSLLSLCCFLMLISSAHADEVNVCYNYGCSSSAKVNFSERQLSFIRSMLIDGRNAEQERNAIARAIGALEAFTGQQTPTWVDRGGNYNDDGLNGRMDCIDHSSNSTTYLKLIQDRGWLKFHRVLSRVVRGFLGQHWTAVIEQIDTHQKYAVDSWFYDNGHPAIIYTLEEWLQGKSPNVY